MGLLMAGQLLSSWAQVLVPAARLRIVAPEAIRIVNVAKPIGQVQEYPQRAP
jgi:hypothetical protein